MQSELYIGDEKLVE